MDSSANLPPSITIGSVARSFSSGTEGLPPPAHDAPLTLFPTELALNREQEKALCKHAQDWYTRLNDEQGRDECRMNGSLPLFLTGTRGRAEDTMRSARKFMSKRALYQMTYQNDVEWRRYLYPGSIFEQSNLTVPAARRITKQSAARCINYFFGTDPWVALHAVGAEDADLSRKLQRLLDIKFIESGSLSTLRRGVAGAFPIGESVLKVSRARRSKRFKESKVVASLNGEPVLAADGGPILETDLWITDAAGREVLKRDGQTPKPPELVFERLVIDQEIVTYQGPEVSKIYFLDFLCPENAKDVQSAPCVIHMMERTASQVAEAYLSGGDTTMETLQNAAALIRDALTSTPEAKTGDRGPRYENGQQEPNQSAEPTTEYMECYVHFDADGDGVTEDIMIMMNPLTGRPVYYNYVANLTDDGLRPFHVITAKPVENRWYGQGTMEEYEEQQINLDLQYNRRNFNQSAAGRVVEWHPELTMEGDVDQNLKMNWGRTYRRKANTDPLAPLVRVYYIDDNKFEHLTGEIEFTLQMLMNESGVQHANDAQAAGMDSAKLATGVRNIEKSGQEMFALPISEIESCLTPLCQAFATSLYGNLEDEETFMYFQDDTPVELTVAARDVANLKFNVQVLLTRFREEQVLQSSSQAVGLIREFYSYPPELQTIQAPLYRDMLKSLQIQRADQYIQPGIAFLGGATGPNGTPQAPQGTPKAPPPNL